MNAWIALVALFGTQAHRDRQLPDNPSNHWIYEALRGLKADGLMVGYPDGGHRPLVETGYSVAIKTLHAMGRFREAARSMLEECDELATLRVPAEDTKARLAAYDADYALLREFRRHFPFFRRAQATFLPQTLVLLRIDKEVVLFTPELERLANRIEAKGRSKARATGLFRTSPRPTGPLPPFESFGRSV